MFLQKCFKRWNNQFVLTGACATMMAWAGAPAFAQTSTSSGIILRSRTNRTTADSEFEQRRTLAVEVATLAARSGLIDLSLEAVERASQRSVSTAAPQFQSSLLGSQNSSTVRSTFGELPQRVDPDIEFGQQLKAVNEVWKEVKAPPEKIYQHLQKMVLTSPPASDIRMWSETVVENGSYFSFNPPVKLPQIPWALGFELVHWAKAAEKLDELIAALEIKATEPGNKNVANALLIFAERMAGRPAAALKRAEAFLATAPQISRDGNHFLSALKSPLPSDQSLEELEPAAVDSLVMRIAQLEPKNSIVRLYALETLSRTIEHATNAEVEKVVSAIETMIDQQYADQLRSTSMASMIEQQIVQQKTSFRAGVERLCRELGKTDLAIDIAVGTPGGGASLGLYGGTSDVRLVDLAKGTSDQRLHRARRLLLGGPIESTEQFGFAVRSDFIAPPAFFNVQDSQQEVVARLKPFEHSSTLSLLDLLLNEVEIRGKTAEIIEELLEKARERRYVTKLIARWVILRAKRRGQTPDQSLVELGKFESQKDFIEWWITIPAVAANEILADEISSAPLKGELAELIQHPTDAALGTRLTSVAGLAESFHQLKNPGAPLRSVSALKHWCLPQANRARLQADSERRLLTLPGGAGSVRYRTGAVMLRYPVTGELTVKGTFASTAMESRTIGINGLSFMLTPQPTNSVYLTWSRSADYRSSNASRQMPLADSNLIEWSQKGDTLSLVIDGETKQRWLQSTAAFPFLSLSSSYWNSVLPPDFVVSGQIPRQVALIDESLTGWSSMFGDPLPPVRPAFKEITPDSTEAVLSAVFSSSEVIAPMWRVQEGELIVGGQAAAVQPSRSTLGTSSQPSADPVSDKQTLLSVNRPLLDGERIDFELFHDSQAQTASPSLGRMAYCFDGGKVSLHWIATVAERKRMMLTEDNRAEDPVGKQLSSVQLKDKAWNRLSLRCEGDDVVLSVEGKDVYRRQTHPEEGASFGFFADPTGPQARVRNVILSGDWPTELPKQLWELAE